MLKGIIYRNSFAYRLDSIRKALYHSLACNNIILPSFRFREAAKHISPNSSILDLCCGPCPLMPYLPHGVNYIGVDGSDGFARTNQKRGIEILNCQIDENLRLPEVECVVMISSLYQFGESSEQLLRQLKKCAQRIVIVEDVMSSAINKTNRPERGLMARCYDYLAVGGTSEGHFVFTADSARAILKASEFQNIYSPNRAYVVGVWNADNPK